MNSMDKSSSEKSKRSRVRIKFIAIAGIALTLVILLTIVCLYIHGRTRQLTVHLVNGLDVSYTVTIDGRSYAIQPNDHVEVQLSQGQLSIAASGTGVNIPTQTLDLKIPAFRLRNPTYVINPDRVAIFFHNGREYVSTNSRKQSRSTQQIHTAKLFYEFYPRVDFFLQPFPREVSMGLGSGMRYQLTTRFRDLTYTRQQDAPHELSLWLDSIRNMREKTELFRRRLEIQPSFANGLPHTFEPGEADGIAEFLPGLSYVQAGDYWMRMPPKSTAAMEHRRKWDDESSAREFEAAKRRAIEEKQKKEEQGRRNVEALRPRN